jgi:hypothetical protein
MNVKQLREALEKYPDHMDVFIGARLTEFKYGLLNGVRATAVEFSEDPFDESPLCQDTAVILEEE